MIRRLLVVYTFAVALVTVVPAGIRRHGHHHGPWWLVVEPVPLHVPPVSFALNIVMFVPFGVLVPRAYAAAGGWARVALWSFAVSLCIEATQLVEWITLGNYRTVDVNDLISNTAGALLGYALLRAFTARTSTGRGDQAGCQARM